MGATLWFIPSWRIIGAFLAEFPKNLFEPFCGCARNSTTDDHISFGNPIVPVIFTQNSEWKIFPDLFELCCRIRRNGMTNIDIRYVRVHWTDFHFVRLLYPNFWRKIIKILAIVILFDDIGCVKICRDTDRQKLAYEYVRDIWQSPNFLMI